MAPGALERGAAEGQDSAMPAPASLASLAPARFTLGLLLALGAAACSQAPTTQSDAKTADDPGPALADLSGPAGAPRGRAVPFAKIKTRTQTITLVSHGGDVRYRVVGERGEVVVAAATLDELRTQAPEAYAVARSAVAGGRGGYVDAILDESVTRPAPTPGAEPAPRR